jgi:glutathionyl-hydroquinone reductase
MGRLVDGKWSTEWYGADASGRFIRDATVFRRRVTADGSSGFSADAGRYHLYVSFACPWAHRTLILRKLKRLDSAISVSVVDPFMGDDGWTLADDPVNGAHFLRDVYTLAKPDYTGRVTVPVLWDKHERTIVNNESREILRMFDHEFSAVARSKTDYCPPGLATEVDAAIDALYEPVNNGVYRAGFARTQAAYEEAVKELFAALDGYERRLSEQRYLCGARLTEADVCFFTTLVRFDPVYHYHFKCNLKRLRDYPNLWNYVRDIYQTPGVAETVDVDQIKRHYFNSHESINPTHIVPLGPVIDYSEPHDRARFG